MTPESILGLFMDDGDGIRYQGMTVRAGAACDGNEHTVEAADGYYHWVYDEF